MYIFFLWNEVTYLREFQIWKERSNCPFHWFTKAVAGIGSLSVPETSSRRSHRTMVEHFCQPCPALLILRHGRWSLPIADLLMHYSISRSRVSLFKIWSFVIEFDDMPTKSLNSSQFNALITNWSSSLMSLYHLLLKRGFMQLVLTVKVWDLITLPLWSNFGTPRKSTRRWLKQLSRLDRKIWQNFPTCQLQTMIYPTRFFHYLTKPQ